MIRDRDPHERDRRLGIWFTQWDIGRRDPEGALALQATVVILEARPDMMHGRIMWFGMAPQFQIVPMGCEIRLYVPHVERRRGAIAVSWHDPSYTNEMARWPL